MHTSKNEARSLSLFGFFDAIGKPLLLIGFLAISHTLMATTYYVSPTGDDTNSGLTTADPWQSIAHVNTIAFVPGDEILFEGGTTFLSTVGLSFTSARSGTALNPIRISSYGLGRATLHISADSAFAAYECAGFEIEDLNFVGAGRLVNDFPGIVFSTDQPTATIPSRHAYIRIRRVDVSGFNLGGIKISGAELFLASGSTVASMGFEDIEISDAEVYDNGDFGIEIVGDWMRGTTIYPNKDILIQKCISYNNAGQNGLTTEHTGNGIVVGTSENVRIDQCVAYNNGAANQATNGGPVGIWMWDTKDGVIENCESYGNKTGSTKDGGGFDLDGGCVNCVIQYCYSHDNDGAGYLLAQFGRSRDMRNNTIRYNVSENDGRNNDYAGIHLWRDAFTGGTGVMDEVYIHNNVIYTSAATGADPAAVRSISGSITRTRIANNVFMAADGIRLIDKQFASDIDFMGNCYFSLTGNYEYNEAGTVYNSLANWRTTGQEVVGGANVGLEQDPMLRDPGNGGIIGNPTNLPNLTAYQTFSGNPLEDAGLDLNTLLGINVGTRDFYGGSIPLNGIPDIGAYEGAGTPLDVKDIRLSGERLEDGHVFVRFDLGLENLPEKVFLERSEDGENFESLVQADLKGRFGHAYDYHPPSIHVFYRLAVVKADGTRDYSQKLEIAPYGKEERMEVFPNPIAQGISIHLFSKFSYKKVNVALLNLEGKSVFSSPVPLRNDTLSFEVPEHINNGVYVLRVQTKTSLLTQQILIDR